MLATSGILPLRETPPAFVNRIREVDRYLSIEVKYKMALIPRDDPDRAHKKHELKYGALIGPRDEASDSARVRRSTGS